MSVFKFQLPNGIKCVHQQVKSTVSYCGLMIGTGSRDEESGEHGMAHLLEHSLFKGTKKRRAYHINSRLENLGGELNAFTTKEETVVHATTLKGDFPKAAELISDIVFNSSFPQKEVDKEKEIISDEINSYKDSPSERIFDDYEDIMFAGSSLGHNILGSKRAVARYKTEDIKRFVDRTYNTDNMVFSYVGNAGEKRFKEICDRYFSEIPSNLRGFERGDVALMEPFNKIVSRGTFQTHCLLGARAYSYMDKKRIPLALLINMLGGVSSNSILNMAVREKNGLSYNIEAGYVPFSDTGMATVYFSTDKENLDRCLEIVDLELKRLMSGDITSRQLSIAKKQFAGQLFISNESGEGLMLSGAKSYMVYDNVESVESIARKINLITKEELTDAANEIFGRGVSSLIYK